MKFTKDHLQVQCIAGIDAVSSGDWNTLVDRNDPFADHAFILGLEQEGCVGDRPSGWVPRHLLAYANAPCGDQHSSPLGALILYEKYDSYGEYIFDWGWARAAQMAGIDYYPKLVSAIPFTPATGDRLLLHPDLSTEQERQVADALVDAALRLTRCEARASSASSMSSLHLLFLRDSAMQHLHRSVVGRRLLPRSSLQYHWRRDASWGGFDDYLAAMRSSPRKQIRRERRRVTESGLALAVKRGTELNDDEWQALWVFYRQTTANKSAIPYLNREFFIYLARSYADAVVASFAYHEGRPVAGALLFSKGQHLYGRYWGSVIAGIIDGLHFELCYYLPIVWALENGIERFEAGAQGEHKIKRGFLPSRIHSAHFLVQPGLHQAVERFLSEEHKQVDAGLAYLNERSPFREQPSYSMGGCDRDRP